MFEAPGDCETLLHDFEVLSEALRDDFECLFKRFQSISKFVKIDFEHFPSFLEAMSNDSDICSNVSECVFEGTSISTTFESDFNICPTAVECIERFLKGKLLSLCKAL